MNATDKSDGHDVLLDCDVGRSPLGRSKSVLVDAGVGYREEKSQMDKLQHFELFMVMPRVLKCIAKK